MVTTRPPKTIVKPTALGPVANTDTKLLIYGLFQKGRVLAQDGMLDADIRGFFDAIDHEWLMQFVEHRIADQRVLRHIKKWLNAGVMEDGKRTQAEKGTPSRGKCIPFASERVSALRVRSMGPPVEEEACSR